MEHSIQALGTKFSGVFYTQITGMPLHQIKSTHMVYYIVLPNRLLYKTQYITTQLILKSLIVNTGLNANMEIFNLK